MCRSEEELRADLLPWMLEPEEAASFNRIVRGTYLPSRIGGRLREPLIPNLIGRFKMHDWHLLRGDFAVYALHKSGAFEHKPR